jgi:hypothetical protein
VSVEVPGSTAMSSLPTRYTARAGRVAESLRCRDLDRNSRICLTKPIV